VTAPAWNVSRNRKEFFELDAAGNSLLALSHETIGGLVKSKSLAVTIGAFAAFSVCSIASAHPGHSGNSGFATGLTHPLGGVDHLLAMFAVGLLAYRMGRNYLWVLPIVFISSMLAGGLFARTRLEIPLTEQIVGVSAVILCILVAIAARVPALVCVGLVSAFAIFHGYAHVSEMAGASGLVSYMTGFTITTALLHALGIAVGVSLRITKVTSSRGSLGLV
jgi:urease accessory protein